MEILRNAKTWSSFRLFRYITFLDECTCYRDRCSEDWAQKTQIFDRTLTRKLRLRLWLRADNKTGQLADCDITKSNYRIIRKKRRPQLSLPPSTGAASISPRPRIPAILDATKLSWLVVQVIPEIFKLCRLCRSRKNETKSWSKVFNVIYLTHYLAFISSTKMSVCFVITSCFKTKIKEINIINNTYLLTS